MPGTTTLTLTGLTPADIGSGLDFDIELTSVPVDNPITLSPVGESDVSGEINVDVAALLSDETGYDNQIIVGPEQGLAAGSSRVWNEALGWSPLRPLEAS